MDSEEKGICIPSSWYPDDNTVAVLLVPHPCVIANWIDVMYVRDVMKSVRKYHDTSSAADQAEFLSGVSAYHAMLQDKLCTVRAVNVHQLDAMLAVANGTTVH